MKIRKRLKPNEIEFLGLPKKKNNRYGLEQHELDLLKQHKKKENSKTAKILIFDIETAPSKSYVWGKCCLLGYLL